MCVELVNIAFSNIILGSFSMKDIGSGICSGVLIKTSNFVFKALNASVSLAKKTYLRLIAISPSYHSIVKPFSFAIVSLSRRPRLPFQVQFWIISTKVRKYLRISVLGVNATSSVPSRTVRNACIKTGRCARLHQLV